MPHIVSIGHLNVEDTVYPDMDVIPKAPGGAALYTAAAAKLWGMGVSLVSRIGSDYPPDYLEAIRKGGVNVTEVQTIPGPTMAGLTQYESDGTRQFKMYTSYDRCLALTPHPSDISDQLINSASGIHLATMPINFQMAWVRRIRSEVSFISLDTDVSLVRLQRDRILEVVQQVDAFLPSITEAETLYPGQTITAMAKQLASLGPRIVVIKSGARGAYLYSRLVNELVHIPAVATQVTDLTGAGDAFCGGFAAGFLKTGDSYEAAWWGAISASMAIENHGALHLLARTRQEAMARLEALKRGTHDVKAREDPTDKH